METWDYKIVEGLEFVSQTEWNQTLILKIDEVSLMTKNAAVKNLVVPKQLMQLINTLNNYQDGTLKNKYQSYHIVETELSKINCLLIEGEQLFILNYPYYL